MPDAAPEEDQEATRSAVEAQVHATFAKVLEGLMTEPEFIAYSDYSNEALSKTRAAEGAVVNDLTPQFLGSRSRRALLANRVERMRRSLLVNRAMAYSLSILASVCAIVAFATPLSFGWPNSGWGHRLLSVSLLAGVSSMVAWRTTLGARRDISWDEAALRAFDNEYETSLHSAVHSRIVEVFSAALQSEMRLLGVFKFPIDAPRLVELAEESVVSSLSIDRVDRFLLDHETSAVGVSGPRGVGKTTLLRAVAARVRSRGGVSAIISAPVEYSPVDLLRGIAFEVNDQLSTGDRIGVLGRKSMSTWIGLLLILGGFGLLIPLVFPDQLAQAWSTIFPLVMLSLASVTVLVGMVLVGRRFRTEAAESDVANLMESLVKDLEYETTRSGGGSVKGLSLGEFTFSESLARRSLSQGDVAVSLRRALQQIAGSGARAVMIAIDELDKLPSRDATIRTINVLKDIMRVPGVHVLVTVSDEALASFGLNGFERDAFDSTFDAIFEVQRLSLPDASRLIDSRVVGYPDKLLAFSLIASAGLARDLIREVRTSIDLARESNPVPPWVVLARTMVDRSAEAAISAYIRTGATLALVPTWTRALRVLDGVESDQLKAMKEIAAVSDELASHYARAIILLKVVRWLDALESDDMHQLEPVINQLRDTVFLSSRRGGAEISIDNLKSIIPDVPPSGR